VAAVHERGSFSEVGDVLVSVSIRTLRWGWLVSSAASITALGVAACSGKSMSAAGSGGGGVGATGGKGGSGSGGVASGGAGSGTGGTTFGSSGEGGEMSDDRPVLERPLREELTCELTTPMRNLGFEWAEGDLASTASGAFLAWGKPAEIGSPHAVMVASIDETGTPNASVPIATYMGSYSSRPRLATSSRGMTLAWTEAGDNEMSRMRLAELDATGAVSKAPVTVSGLAERLSDVSVVPTATGNALHFVHTSVDYRTSSVRVALLDADAIIEKITDLLTLGEAVAPPGGAFVATPFGFAGTSALHGRETETYLSFLDATGAPLGEWISLARPRPSLGVSMLVRGNELLVAFVEEDGGYENSDIAGYIGLARFDLTSRTLTAPVARVQTPTIGEETVNPVLFAVGDDVGLLWSRGSVIYVCAGCMPDNHLEAVIMDGDDFTPISALLTLPNEEPMGGFIRPMVTTVGEHLVVAATLRFHVSGAAASGAFRCTPAP
jgi:hypothetical protein